MAAFLAVAVVAVGCLVAGVVIGGSLAERWIARQLLGGECRILGYRFRCNAIEQEATHE